MKITQEVREFAAKNETQTIELESAEQGMEKMSAEFRAKGAAIYHEATD
ncbi:hypothetical protein JCM19232_4515 [Vibrio ishigakensis]|uniref:Uncharacterized protein n=1 Tax=Vibrio ishigakensis TaxID=1481914 RepID=A0A0B8PIE6_9VIBR|nr:hypothetical protein JCM19232_4515 [Vibrio ishigakensis]